MEIYGKEMEQIYEYKYLEQDFGIRIRRENQINKIQ